MHPVLTQLLAALENGQYSEAAAVVQNNPEALVDELKAVLAE